MGLILQLLLFMLERFGEHTVLVFDIALILLLIHYVLNIRRIARLIRYLSMMNDPLIPTRNPTGPLSFHMAMD